ncbi:SRPBCC domain-containing protein [Methylocystis sp. JR02]|uniref:SRPBCC family protein n=1 Tax=Methylocystis sp. JR02 TaxID=3046284 RepID=UPI0024BA8EE8|nr:SRPBCC domain-containing protein [Methylocystis sp. JR02]MDJ0449587.1 SRPBCC domain-containing protein [Methylocystis sp. JR02]
MDRATDDVFSTLVVSRRFAAPPEIVFDAWFDAKAVGAWLFATPGGQSAHVEIDARVGGGFAIHEQRGESLATHFGEYREIDRPRRIVFALATDKDGPRSLVTVEIEADGAGSLLTLTHRVERAPIDASMRAGWESILEGLARATGEAGAGYTIVMRRTFDAPRVLVWKAWTEADHLLRWMCPANFNVLFAENELRIGGKWRSGMRSPEGEDFIHCGEYIEIEKPSRLVFTHRWERNSLEPQANTMITVVLTERDGKTDMIFIHAGLATVESACSHQNGWTGAFDYLARHSAQLAQDSN